ncbi:hypothetical protein, partial [Pedobacter sp. ASV12]|uniref:hypothetical protein n=1 Tax=Pedobacter sp. ASV12 TaxID=2795120 RepID=UPI001E35A029
VEDFYLWLNLVANGYKVVLIKEALVKYYVSNQSISRNHIQIANLKYLSCLMLLKIRYPDAKVSNLLFLFTGITQLLKYVIKRIRKK